MKISQFKTMKNIEKYIKLPFIILYGTLFWIHAVCRLFFKKIFSCSPKSLNNEIILITGSAQGIGKDMAIYLAKNYPSAKLVLWDLQELENKKTEKIVQKLGASGTSYTIDITHRPSVEHLAKKVEKEIGPITILINNAGISGIGNFLYQSPEVIEKTINVNLLSHFWTLRAFMPGMIERNHGHIVTICSLASFQPIKLAVAYTASKHGVVGYLRSLEGELRTLSVPTNKIIFTTVYPYFIKSEMTAGVTLDSKMPSLLDSFYVAKNIIEGIRRNKQQIFLPWYSEISCWMYPLLPSLFRIKFEDWFTQDLKVVFE